MDAKSGTLQQRKRQLLRELAGLQVEEMVEAGDFDRTPHFGRLERAAAELGGLLCRETLEQASREAAAGGPIQVACPICGLSCAVATKTRTVKGVAGPVELTEAVADCRRCRRSFFPSADGDGAR